MGEEFRQAHGVRDAMEALCAYGLTPEEALRIWRVIGPACLDLIRENPYCMCEEGTEIPFEKETYLRCSRRRFPACLRVLLYLS